MQWVRSIIAASLGIILSGGCATMGELMQAPGQPTARTVTATGQTGETVGPQPPTCSGPLATVAVYRFTDRTAKGKGHAWYSPQIGDGMADMLTDALLQSGCFRVVDRQALQDVLQEQDLATGGRAARPTGPALGQIRGAQYLVKGAVTEFEPGAAGARAGVGAGWTGAVIGGVLGGLRASHVAMVVQVVDATTSDIVASTTVEGKATDFDLGGFLGGFAGGFAGVGGLGVWQKTPVEKAIRIAIVHATREVATRVTPKEPAAVVRSAGPTPPGPPPVPSTAQGGPQTAPAPQAALVAPPPAQTAPRSPDLPSAVTVQLDSVALRDSASMEGKVIAVVKRGTGLPVMAKEGEWFAVHWGGGIAYAHQSTVTAK